MGGGIRRLPSSVRTMLSAGARPPLERLSQSRGQSLVGGKQHGKPHGKPHGKAHGKAHGRAHGKAHVKGVAATGE